jgi:collagenase-like PrtC family protease
MIYRNIVLGLDSQSNLQELLTFGINQFYIGYIPTLWREKYSSQQSLNRRYLQKEQMYDITTLENIYHTIKSAGAKLYLTLNAPFSNEEMLLHTNSLLDETKHLLFDSYIGGNIAILELLKTRQLPITLSTTLGVYSASSVVFFIKMFQPKRVILPRDMMLSEIESIATKHKNQEFEVFLYGDSCRWSDGHCFVEHGYDSIDRGLPFCMHLKENAKPLARLDPLFKAKLKNGTFSFTTINEKSLLPQNDFTQKESFSKLSSVAIHEALEFFAKFENIRGYKIPSRGRDAIKLLSYIQKDSQKHYQTALYL